MKRLFVLGFICVLIFTGCKENTNTNKNIIENSEFTKVEEEPLDILNSYPLNIVHENSIIAPTKSFELFKFPLPEQYRYYVSSGQGMRGSIKNVNAGGGSSTATYHNAIDFAVPVGTKVYAAKSGYVTNAYPSAWNGSKWKGHPTYGGMIEIQHPDGTVSLYAHLIMTEVREGVFVKQGQEIGLTGGERGKRGSGNSTGPHLHFSIYVNIEDMLLK